MILNPLAVLTPILRELKPPGPITTKILLQLWILRLFFLIKQFIFGNNVFDSLLLDSHSHLESIRLSFNNAIKEFVFYTDGDGQYDVKELVVLCKKMNENIDYVNGYKLKRNDPWYRIVIGKIYHHTMKLIFGFKIRDVDCDFRLIKRSIFDRVELKNNSGVICVEMITKFHQSNLKFTEVGVTHYHRLHGKSQFFNFSRIIRVIIDLFYLWCELKLNKPTIRKQNCK